MDWKEFEDIARNAIQKELGCTLSNDTLDITGKSKNFDLVNESRRIVGDIKYYSMTKGGNIPSAKFSTLNEYAWLMQRLEKSTKHKWKKVFVIGTDKSLVEKYIETYGKWLDDIEIYYCSKSGKISRMARIRAFR